MKIGDWVEGIHDETKIVGFIINEDKKYVEIDVVKPKDYFSVVMKKNEIVVINDTINKNDIKFLIDFALDLNDKEWFEYLSTKLILNFTDGKINNYEKNGRIKK